MEFPTGKRIQAQTYYKTSSSTKLKSRRSKANARERSRMHHLNAALDRLRRHIPISSTGTHKLSKIETLRIAGNYIQGLNSILEQNETLDPLKFVNVLSRDLSQATTNLLSSFLNPSQLASYPQSSQTLFSANGILLEYQTWVLQEPLELGTSRMGSFENENEGSRFGLDYRLN